MTDPAFHRLFELPVLAVESDLLRRSNPAAAAAAATRAIETATARGDRARLPQFHLRLAKANIVWGKLERAEKALLDGIDAFEETRSKPTTVTGVTAFDESWELYETGVQLAIRSGDNARAFALAERGRNRSHISSPTTSLTEIQSAQSTNY